ncbi:hypothetical protein [Rubinisphaera italica]|uniref:Uncharacterized protein n=1 Tax=Rubinisphaera italica TaxID=2527969 RepID=A0A5C5XPH7_9PLAN|nr:hypothetical protein [Rubinisphaera italica]TWT64469.1 hypothetical protein Pan54_52330 [Rubinisphaera italica]
MKIILNLLTPILLLMVVTMFALTLFTGRAESSLQNSGLLLIVLTTLSLTCSATLTALAFVCVGLAGEGLGHFPLGTMMVATSATALVSVNLSRIRSVSWVWRGLGSVILANTLWILICHLTSLIRVEQSHSSGGEFFEAGQAVLITGGMWLLLSILYAGILSLFRPAHKGSFQFE